jgi:hypothetical protein
MRFRYRSLLLLALLASCVAAPFLSDRPTRAERGEHEEAGEGRERPSDWFFPPPTAPSPPTVSPPPPSS